MAIEVQTDKDTITGMDATDHVRVGQKLTITNRVVSRLGFQLVHAGTAISGNITFAIRKVSTDAVILSKVYGDASTIPDTYPAVLWQEVEFDTPTNINEEVYLSVEWSGGSGAAQLAPSLHSATDAKAGESCYAYKTSWHTLGANTDLTYYYVYTTNPTLAVSTLPNTDISGSTATGNGRIDKFGSDAAVTQHGHCWATATNPTTADSKTTNGAKSTLGTFTSAITGLIPGTTYYVRAYGTDSSSTVYGDNFTFVGGQPEPAGELIGLIAVVQTRLHYLDAYGAERYIEGTAI